MPIRNTTNTADSNLQHGLPTADLVTTTTHKTPATATAPMQLSDTYYLENFNYLVSFVEQHYLHLLTLHEQQFCNAFNAHTENAQQLFVRLVLRTPTHIRLSKIKYPDINIGKGIDELCQSGLLTPFSGSLEECLPLFSQAELRNALGALPADLAQINPEAWTTPDLFGDSPAVKLLNNDAIVTVGFKEVITTFKLLFFGNLYHDFSSFVLRDLGYQTFESYTIDSETLLFKSREQVDAHLAYFDCAARFEDACVFGSDQLEELYNLLPSPISDDKTLCRRLDKLKNKIARQLEREAELDLAALIYSKTVNPPARERLARIHAKQGNTQQALTLCQQISASPRSYDELDFASMFGHKLARKLDKKQAAHITRIETYKPPESYLSLDQSNLCVEFAVALHLAKTGKCYYLENNLLSGVFGLAFWDITFSPVTGAFFHPFHSAPADFHEPEFVRSRQVPIDNRLNEIAEGNLRRVVNQYLYQKKGIRNPLVNWSMSRKHVIDLALQRIPANHWHAVFNHLLTDIKNLRSGQPDLAYFPDDGGYQLLEVKAPGDKLQKNQQRWMEFFSQENIPHGIVHVEWLDA